MDYKDKNAGFSVDAIKYMLGGRFRASFRPLNDAIIQNRIFGIAGITGCTDREQKPGEYINILIEELLERNVLILQTGCRKLRCGSAAIGSDKAGELTLETALKTAGAGLREVCEAFGIPPVLHLGSCFYNTRILETAEEIVKEGGLGDDFRALPFVCVAGESDNVNNYLHNGASEDFNACFHHYADPYEAVTRITEIINKAREGLGINKKHERKLFDMKDRRDL